ncbi:hypothetical protein RRG08_006305 [Elysia crispata]|uniref:Uncharacterized protein n=1 Tax=Elysia crispata TaxID=231223 RepID=A0AAE0YPT7_9GAST|nr:hypothetical protein RRG08_006305 [Elysia crispata]
MFNLLGAYRSRDAVSSRDCDLGSSAGPGAHQLRGRSGGLSQKALRWEHPRRSGSAQIPPDLSDLWGVLRYTIFQRLCLRQKLPNVLPLFHSRDTSMREFGERFTLELTAHANYKGEQCACLLQFVLVIYRRGL